jgi:hypothetical protein
LARLFVSLDLKCNFFHFPGLDYSQRQSRHVIL